MAGRKIKADDQILRNRGCRFSDVQWARVVERALRRGVDTHEYVRSCVAEAGIFEDIYDDPNDFVKAYPIARAALKSIDTAASMQTRVEAELEIERRKGGYRRGRTRTHTRHTSETDTSTEN